MASIRKNFIYNIILNVSSVLFPLITAPYISRVLNPYGRGLAGFAFTYVGYFSMFAALGIQRYGLREISKKRDSKEDRQKLLSELMTLTMINTIVVAVVYFLSFIFITKVRENSLIFLIASISLLVVPLDVSWYFKGMEQFGFITSRNLIFRVITIVCLFLFVHSQADIYIYMLLSIFSSIGAVFLNFYELKKEGVRPCLRFHGIKRHYKPMFILFASAVAISIYTMFDTLMLGFICDYDEVGYYVSATSISKVSLAVVTSLSAVAVPRVAYYAKEKDFKAINDLISKSIAVVSTLAFPMAVGLACISPTFVPLFLGETFRDAVWPTIIMSGVIIAIGYNNLTGSQILIGCGLDKSFLKCMLVGTISNFLLNLLMIPIWGASGAAASSVIAETLILITTIIHIKKYTPVKLNMASKDVLISILSSMLFIPVSIGLNHLLSGWELVISVIATCGMLYMLMQIFFKTQIYQMTYSFVRKKIHM